MGLFTDEQKETIGTQIDTMVNEGADDATIQAYIDEEKAKLTPAQDQTDVPVQGENGGSISGDGTSDSAGVDIYNADTPELKPDESAGEDVSAWDNVTNSLENVMTRIYGFDDRLSLAATDAVSSLFGEDVADKIYSVFPTYDTETGQWLNTADKNREVAYRELAEIQGETKDTIGIIEGWESGDPLKMLSSVFSSGTNILSSGVTAALTGGIGLYTDMMGDAIYDANTEKAKKLGISLNELYDKGESEFLVPATVGLVGGKLERMGLKGVGTYINGLTSGLKKNAIAMANNMGKEGLTEWLQTGLETYNFQRGGGDENAAGTAIETMFSREGLEAALQGAVGAGAAGGAGRGAKRIFKKRKDDTTKGTDPDQDLADAAGVEDYVFDPKENETTYKSQVEEVAKAQSLLDQDVEETTPEDRDQAEQVIKEDAKAKKQKKVAVDAINTEYTENTEAPTEAGRIAYVAKKLGEQEGVQTFDEALGLANVKNRDVMKIAAKAGIAMRTPAETEAFDVLNDNLFEAKRALEFSKDPIEQKYIQKYVDELNTDLLNKVSTSNKKILYANPVDVASALESADIISDLDSQKETISNNTNLTDKVKEGILNGIEDKKNAAIEQGEQARTAIEKASSQSIEATDNDAKFFEEVLQEEVTDNEKSTDDIVRSALDLGIVEDPDSDSVIDETLSENRQPIGMDNGVKVYGKRFGGIKPNRTEAIQAGKQIELDAKAKGYKTDITYKDVNPEKAGGETQVEAEIYKPREGKLSDAVESKRNELAPDQDQQEELSIEGQEEAVEGQEAPVEGQEVGEDGRVRDKATGKYTAEEFSFGDSGISNFKQELTNEDIAAQLYKRKGPKKQYDDLSSLQLNIGLENSPKSRAEILKQLRKETPSIYLQSSEQNDSNGESLVIQARFDGNGKDARNLVQKLANELNQESIPVKLNNGKGALVFNDNFEGEKPAFDPTQFKNPSKRIKRGQRADDVKSYGEDNKVAPPTIAHSNIGTSTRTSPTTQLSRQGHLQDLTRERQKLVRELGVSRLPAKEGQGISSSLSKLDEDSRSPRGAKGKASRSVKSTGLEKGEFKNPGGFLLPGTTKSTRIVNPEVTKRIDAIDAEIQEIRKQATQGNKQSSVPRKAESVKRSDLTKKIRNLPENTAPSEEMAKQLNLPEGAAALRAEGLSFDPDGKIRQLGEYKRDRVIDGIEIDNVEEAFGYEPKDQAEVDAMKERYKEGLRTTPAIRASSNIKGLEDNINTFNSVQALVRATNSVRGEAPTSLSMRKIQKLYKKLKPISLQNNKLNEVREEWNKLRSIQNPNENQLSKLDDLQVQRGEIEAKIKELIGPLDSKGSLSRFIESTVPEQAIQLIETGYVSRGDGVVGAGESDYKANDAEKQFSKDLGTQKAFTYEEIDSNAPIDEYSKEDLIKKLSTPGYAKSLLPKYNRKIDKDSSVSKDDLLQTARLGVALGVEKTIQDGGGVSDLLNNVKAAAQEEFKELAAISEATKIDRQSGRDYAVIQKAKEALYTRNGIDPSFKEIAAFVKETRPSKPISEKRIERIISDVEATKGAKSINQQTDDNTGEIDLGSRETDDESVSDVNIADEGGTNTAASKSRAKLFKMILPRSTQNSLKGKVLDIITRPHGDLGFTGRDQKDDQKLEAYNNKLDKEAREAVLPAIKGKFLTEIATEQQISKGIAEAVSNRVLTGLPLPEKITAREVYDKFFGADKNSNDTIKLRNAIADSIVTEIESQYQPNTSIDSTRNYDDRVENKSTPDTRYNEFSIDPISDSSNLIDEAVTHLKKINPNTKFLTDKKVIEEIVQRSGFHKSVAARFRGAYMRNGDVALNMDNINLDTPFHEVGHGYLKGLKASHPKFYAKAASLAKRSKTYKNLKNHDFYKDYTEARLLEEVMATDIGLKGAEIFNNKRDATRWDNWVKKAKEFTAKILNMSPEAFESMTYGDFIDGAASNVATGQKTSSEIDSIPESNAKNPESAIEYSVKQPENKAKIVKEILKQAAAKKAKQSSKKDSVLKRFSNWFTGPATDDYHGLEDRFSRKNPNDPYVQKFKNLTKKYEDDYEDYEIASDKARTNFTKSGKKLAKDLGVKEGKIEQHLAKDSKIKIGDNYISNDQAMALYSDRNNPNIDQSIKDQLSKLPKPMKEFVDSLPYKMKVGDGLQQGLLNHINKGLLKENLADFLQYKKANFSDSQLADIAGKVGNGYESALKDSLDRMSGVSKPSPDGSTRRANTWLQGSVGVTMFLNLKSFPLQGLSIWNYSSPGNFLGFNKDLGKTMIKGSEQHKLFKELWNDPMMKERRAKAGFDVNANEISDAMADGDFNRGVEKLLNKGFILTSGMDSIAIAMGGAAYINQGLKSGKFKNMNEAKKAWRKQTQENQQSARPDRVSQQQKSPVAKFVLAFANTPAQYFRKSQKAYRVFKDKNSTSKDKMKAAKDIAYYMAVQNAIFTMAQGASTALLTGWGGEEEEQKDAEYALNSMADTWLRGMGLFGAVASSLKNSGINAYRESNKANPNIGLGLLKGAVGVAPPLSRKINDLLAIGNAYKYNDKTGFRGAHAVAGSRAIAAGLNLPTDWLQKKLAATQALYEGDADMMEFIQMFGGYSEYSVLNRGKDQDDQPDFIFDDSAFETDDSAFETDDSDFEFES